MLMLDTYVAVWPMCVGIFSFFVIVSALATWVRIPKLDAQLSTGGTLWACLISWFILSSVCLTLIDHPYFNVSGEVKSWMFMISAFLGIPLTIPLLTGMMWAWGCQLRNEPVRLGALTLVMLAGLGLGCAPSNVHDVVWCGAITDWYAQHHAAGSDLAAFVWLGNLFHIPRSVTEDYATLGPCAIVMVVGELLVFWAAFARLNRSYKRGA